MSTVSLPNLAERWFQLRRTHPYLSAHKEAATLGVSEAELVASGCGRFSTRLIGPWKYLLQDLHMLGEVSAITRNELATLTHIGAYHDVDDQPPLLSIKSGTMSLQIDTAKWRHAFAFYANGHAQPSRGIAFFDQFGQLVHRLTLTDSSDLTSFERLLAVYRAPNQSTDIHIEKPPQIVAKQPPRMSTSAFHARWREVDNQQDLAQLLHDYHLDFPQGLVKAGRNLAREVGVVALRSVFDAVQQAALPISIRVENAATTHTFTGVLKRISHGGPWCSVFADGFNMYLREASLQHIWVVRRPKLEQSPMSLECLDAQGQLIASVRAAQPGLQQPWQTMLGSLPGLERDEQHKHHAA